MYIPFRLWAIWHATRLLWPLAARSRRHRCTAAHAAANTLEASRWLRRPLRMHVRWRWSYGRHCTWWRCIPTLRLYNNSEHVSQSNRKLHWYISYEEMHTEKLAGGGPPGYGRIGTTPVTCCGGGCCWGCIGGCGWYRAWGGAFGGPPTGGKRCDITNTIKCNTNGLINQYSRFWIV